MPIFVCYKCFRYYPFRINGYDRIYSNKDFFSLLNYFNMQQVKDFLNLLDFIVGTYWSITMMDVLPMLFSGQIQTSMLSNISGFVNLLLAIAGLIYLVVRLVHFVRMSKLHIESKKQDIIAKKNMNFYTKWDKEFIEPFKEK